MVGSTVINQPLDRIIRQTYGASAAGKLAAALLFGEQQGNFRIRGHEFTWVVTPKELTITPVKEATAV